jgi:hypothetical protein
MEEKQKKKKYHELIMQQKKIDINYQKKKSSFNKIDL